MKKRPSPKSAIVSESMRHMPETATNPEVMVRRSLFRKGLRFRVQYPVPGFPRRTIDIAFPGIKVAIFIDGCFWHGCTQHRGIPANNHEWWKNKIEGNRSRDCETDLGLRENGWIVLRYWEHDSVERVTVEVSETVKLRRNLKERKS